jgi:hypothetical protein
VQIDAIAIRLRQRAPMEAADLGVRLCQVHARAIWRCYLVVAVPFIAISLASFELAPTWLPVTLIWWGKPWLDRTILFVLARAAFGQTTTPGDLWQAQRRVWWSQLFSTWTWRRLSPWRSFTQAVYQLEGQSFFAARRRVVQLRRRRAGSPFLMTAAYSMAELSLTLGVASLALWFAPEGVAPDFNELYDEEGLTTAVAAVWAIAYAIVVLFLEPFYVASGFGMYLNRRAELEAWDIEQEFRRAFAK